MTGSTRKAAGTPANEAVQARARKAAAKPAASPTLGSFDAASVDTHKRSGVCGQRLPVKKFPTVTGTTHPVAECQSCKDARKPAAEDAR